MNTTFNQKMIQERCGSVSFKRGHALYRSGKVCFSTYHAAVYRATVASKEAFLVTIEKGAGGDLRTTCSCPTLAGFTKDCQHIAAVLLAITDHQRSGTLPAGVEQFPVDTQAEQELSNELMNLFQEVPVRKSGQQRRFENRQVVTAEFACQSVESGSTLLFGMELKINANPVNDVRKFLKRVKQGKPASFSSGFTFHSIVHCFAAEADAVIQFLMEVVDDEKANRDQNRYHAGGSLLPIPPSAWEKLLSLLRKVPDVKVKHDDQHLYDLSLSEEILPLQFDLLEGKSKGYSLQVTGLDKLIVMDMYKMVLYNGALTRLDVHAIRRLGELKRLLNESKTSIIAIPKEQLAFFLEKVIPGLKSLGKVNIAEGMHQQLPPPPLLTAKLYLDRLNNRLLAGLEFHYEHIMINPLENKERDLQTMLVRDTEKEEEILKLMDDSMFTKTESGYFLYNEELEYDFLYYVVPKLQKLTHVYTTTAVRTRLVKENTFPKIKVKVKKERINWLEFKLEMDGVPEDQIRDVLEALEEKRKYYRLRNGSLLSLETKEIQEIQRFLHGLPDTGGNLETGLRLPVEQSLQLLDTVETSPVFLTEDSLHQFLQAIRHPERGTFAVPSGIDAVLHDYQTAGFQWMKTLAGYGFGGILADDMGLGKTVQSIAYMLSISSDIREKQQPVLVVCPSSVVYNWHRELARFAPQFTTKVIDGKKTERVNQWKNPSHADVVITSYPVLRRDIHQLDQHYFHTVFFDEAQAFKNPLTQTARAVKRLQASHRFALTGTPIENSLEELWAVFHVVFPALFSGLREYSQLSKQTIARRARPFLLRRLKTEVLTELPQKSEIIQSTELLTEQKTLYAAYLAKLRQETLKHLDQETFRKNKIRILAGITRLRQICCHPGLFVNDYHGGSAKFNQLLQLVEEAKQSGRRVLIFSQFTSMLDLIGRALIRKGHLFFYLDGQTPAAERLEMSTRFNDGERDFFLISLKAGGTGLNLTGADTVIMYDSWWNPAVEEQAADRAYRIGQKHPVQVIKLVARGTIEEKMQVLQEKKRHLIEEVIDSDEKSVVLTETDIRELLLTD